MSNLVSVIMPAYNAARHIAESIECVRAQTYSSWELVVVDDGSTDNTRQVVEHYCTQDQRIKYLYQDNARQGRARNNGIAHSRGEYIAFLDSDDLWLPQKLALQIRELEQRRGDLVFADTYVFSNKFDLPAALIGVLPTLNTKRGVFAGEDGLNLFLENNRIPILTVLTKRSVIDAVGGFTENRLVQNAEDYHLWMKLLLAGFILVGLDLTLAAYRKHSSSVSDAAGQNLEQVIEAKVDLANMYPERRGPIIASIKYTLLLSLERMAKYSEKNAYAMIDRYLQISDKQLLRPLFIGFQKFGARRLALRSMYFVLNYL